MSYRALIVTPWASDAEGNRPAFHDAGIAYLRWTDVTGQDVAQITPEPNAYTIEVEVATEAELEAIAAHPAGFVELYREEVIDGEA